MAKVRLFGNLLEELLSGSIFISACCKNGVDVCGPSHNPRGLLSWSSVWHLSWVWIFQSKTWRLCKSLLQKQTWKLPGISVWQMSRKYGEEKRLKTMIQLPRSPKLILCSALEGDGPSVLFFKVNEEVKSMCCIWNRQWLEDCTQEKIMDESAREEWLNYGLFSTWHFQQMEEWTHLIMESTKVLGAESAYEYERSHGLYRAM